jgi:hypothetical protein
MDTCTFLACNGSKPNFSLLRTWLILGFLAAGAYTVYAVRKAATQFSFKIVGYGKPTVAGPVLTIPFVVALHNPAAVRINLDWIRADLFILKGGQWVPSAHVDQALSVPAGDSQVVITASTNLGNIFGGNFIYTVTALAEAFSNKLQVRIELKGMYGGVTIPTQVFTETLQIV